MTSITLYRSTITYLGMDERHKAQYLDHLKTKYNQPTLLITAIAGLNRSVLVAEILNATIRQYNSLKDAGYDNFVGTQLVAVLQSHFEDKDWLCVDMPLPFQSNNYDCRVFNCLASRVETGIDVYERERDLVTAAKSLELRTIVRREIENCETFAL